MSRRDDPLLLILEGKSICMYQQIQPARRFYHLLWIVLVISSDILLTSCGTIPGAPAPGVSSESTLPAPVPTTTSAPNPTPTATSTTRTIFLIMMENHNWSDIKNNSSASYINHTLLPMASYAEQYYNPPGIHPSEPNYLWLEAGTNFGIFDDNNPARNNLSTKQHLVMLLSNAGISWKSFQEGISGSDCPLTGNGEYAPKHNPMVFFNDVTDGNNPNSANCIAHVRPYKELLTDLQKNTQARYNFITPNLCDDMHDTCSPYNDAVKQGDTWLQQNLPVILNSQVFQNGGTVLITWDEGEGGDGP